MSLYQPLIYFVLAISPDSKIEVIPFFLKDIPGIHWKVIVGLPRATWHAQL